jgi:sarcosine oxidase
LFKQVWSLDLHQSYDIVVLGLGAMGSAALYQLAKRGERVLGIDQFAPPHVLGSSHGDTRITRQAIGEGHHFVPLALRSRDIWHSLERRTGKSLYVANGCLIFGREGECRGDHGTADFLEVTRRAATDFGIAHELLDYTQLRQRFPQFHYLGDEVAYLEPGGGYLLPEECIAVNLACAREDGATTYLNQRVTALEPSPTGEGVTLRCGDTTIRAARVIITAGAWAGSFLPTELASHLKVYRQVLHWFPLTTDPAPYFPERCPVFIRLSDTQNEMMYGFPAVNGVRGGLKVACEMLEETCDPDNVPSHVSAAETEHLWRQASRFLPLGPRPVKQTTCLYTVTPDFGFVLDRHPQYPQIVIASACSGHGFKHSAAIGEVLANLACDEAPNADISAFSFSRLHQYACDD